MGSNTVIAHDDYIQVVWDGPQNADKVRQSNVDTLAAVSQLKSKNRPILISFRIQNHPPNSDLGAFKEVLKIFDAADNIDRIAISGKLPHMIMSLVSTVTNSFNKSLEIKYFDDQVQAMAWLKG